MKNNPNSTEIIEAIRAVLPVGQPYQLKFGMIVSAVTRTVNVQMDALQYAVSLMVVCGELKVSSVGTYWRAF